MNWQHDCIVIRQICMHPLLYIDSDPLSIAWHAVRRRSEATQTWDQHPLAVLVASKNKQGHTVVRSERRKNVRKYPRCTLGHTSVQLAASKNRAQLWRSFTVLRARDAALRPYSRLRIDSLTESRIGQSETNAAAKHSLH